MDSPPRQQSATHRMRSYSNLSLHRVDSRGAIRKRTPSFTRTVSSTTVDHLYDLALSETDQSDITGASLTSAPQQWLTPQSSPQPQTFTGLHHDSIPQWNLPTPPRSDSGIPTVSVDSNEVPIPAAVSSSSTDCSLNPYSTSAAEMNSLGFLLPSHYGSGTIEAEPSSYSMDQNYISGITPTAATSIPPAHNQTDSANQGLYQRRTVPTTSQSLPRSSEYQMSNPSYNRLGSSYDSSSASAYSMVTVPSIQSIGGITHSPQTSPYIGTSPSIPVPQFQHNASRSPGVYGPSIYGQQFSASPTVPATYVQSQSLSYPPAVVGSSSKQTVAKSPSSDGAIRVLNQRPKPQCWEHGCNGRQFSTFSNLLRHQREKSGNASKSYCPKCGAEFTRTTARNGHLAHDKCTKNRRSDE